MQLKVKTILNAIQHFVGFVYEDIRLCRDRHGHPRRIEVTVQPHGRLPPKCSRCLEPAPGYDQLPQRSWLFVPPWGIKSYLLYAPRRGGRVRGHARTRLNALLASKLATARAWTLKDGFEYFWHYKSFIWAGAFLDYWCSRAMGSRLEPMQKVARMLRAHEDLLLNWFKAKGEISSGAVEGLNNKIRVVTRGSYGFRTYEAMEMALYHSLGRLPEPGSTHKFC